MKLILLSGGSGRRLWPLSNATRSKQFLRVLNGESGELQSMLQRVWGQLREVGLQDDSFICAGNAQAEVIKSQLGKVPLIVEPEQRDTFAAVALSSLYMKDVIGMSSEEVMVVMPVDSYVEIDYYNAILQLEEAVRNSGYKMGLIGIKPTCPSEKYGYIQTSERNCTQEYLQADAFYEKPEEKEASQLIKEGALWNCGVFGFQLSFIETVLSDRGLPTDYQRFLMEYQRIPKNSFDYEVVEETSSIVVVPYEGEWKDLGTWNTLTEEMKKPVTGLGTVESSEGTHVINELNIPIAALGVKNVVIAASSDGILVADKSNSNEVKNLVKNITLRPMTEEKRWGNYRVLDYTKLQDGQEVLTKMIEIKDGCNLSYQRHFKRQEVWTVVEGNGWVVLDDHIKKINPGDVVKVELGQWHAVKASEELKIIEVQQGEELIEEDIERLYMDWKEIETVVQYGLVN